MKNSLLLIITAMIMVAFSACNKPEEKQKIDLKNAYDSLSYSMGVSFASQIEGSLQQMPFDSISNELIGEAINSIMHKEEALLNQGEAEGYLETYFMAKQSEMMKERENEYAGNKMAGIQFLEENAKRKEVVVLPSGLQYEIIKNGTGTKPVVTDSIVVHYHGTLIDGQVFDSSVDRKDPASFRLYQVIRGWQEGLSLMSEGSKWKLYVPAELAYGPDNKGIIKPYSALVFEVELIKVVK